MHLQKLRTTIFFFGACLPLVAACGETDSGAAAEPTDAPASTPDDDPSPTPNTQEPGPDAQQPGSNQPDAASDVPLRDDVLVGNFDIELVVESGNQFAAVIGRVNDRPTPSLVVWTEVEAANGCALIKPSIPVCSDACDSGEVCTGPDECTAQPTALNVGAVEVSGVERDDGDTTWSMDALEPRLTYQPIGFSLAYPPYEEGDELSVSALGKDLPAFKVTTTGIAELELLNDGDILMAPGEPTTLTWNPPKDPSASRLLVDVDISHHGGQKGAIQCDVPDNGELELTAELITGLIDLGFSGFPTVKLMRRSTGSVATPAGRVELRASASVERGIEIPGLVSCGEPGTPEGCPDGQTCQQDLRCD